MSILQQYEKVKVSLLCCLFGVVCLYSTHIFRTTLRFKKNSNTSLSYQSYEESDRLNTIIPIQPQQFHNLQQREYDGTSIDKNIDVAKLIRSLTQLRSTTNNTTQGTFQVPGTLTKKHGNTSFCNKNDCTDTIFMTDNNRMESLTVVRNSAIIPDDVHSHSIILASNVSMNESINGAVSTPEFLDEILHDDNNNDGKNVNDDTINTCRVYMAPSTISGAGYGLFAGVSFHIGDLVTPGDGVVPIYDPVFNNNNEEHVNTFLWDEYVWSASTFNGMEVTNKGMDAASFGIGALPNCYFALLNVEDSSDHGRDYTNLEQDGTSPGIGAFTPWYDRKSYATKPIEVGSELFVDYGYAYFTSRSELFGPVPFLEDYDIADQILHRFTNTTNDVDSTVTEDLFNLSRDLLGLWESRVTQALPDNVTVISNVLQQGGTIQKDYARSIRDVDYLKTYGACLDHLYVAPSRAIPHAGRGVFVSRNFTKGSIVTTVPLIHIPERRVMTIYDEAKVQSDEPKPNLTNPIHQQLLLNYCFGHHQSTLLLCPYGVVSSMINHAPIVNNNNNATSLLPLPNANVRIKWSTKITRNPEWWHLNVSDWAYLYRAGLAFEYIALRDIAANEEIFIDYGSEWQDAWDTHVANWKPLQRIVDVMNGDIDSVIPTDKEREWYNGDINMNPNAVNLWCYEIYRTLQGLPETDEVAFPCKVVLRLYDNNVDSYIYTAEIIERRQNQDHDVCDEILDEVLWSLPRDAFAYGGYKDVYDTNQYLLPSTFRHEIGIPDSIMPRIWKNLM